MLKSTSRVLGSKAEPAGPAPTSTSPPSYPQHIHSLKKLESERSNSDLLRTNSQAVLICDFGLKRKTRRREPAGLMRIST